MHNHSRVTPCLLCSTALFVPTASCLQGTLYKKCGVLFLSQWIHLHSFHCLSLLRAHSNYQQLRSATTVHILSPSVTEKKNGLLLVHSCSFDTTLSLAFEDALHTGLFAVKLGFFLPFYCLRHRKNSGCICVQTQLLHTVFVLWLVWDGGRCGMFLYKRNNGGEDLDACKKWMHALITVMAAAFHLVSLECLVTPSFFAAMSNNSHEEASEHSLMLCHIPACLYLHTCTDPWQVAMAGRRAAVTRSGRLRTGKTSWAQLAAIPQGYMQAIFELHKNSSW